MVAIVGGAIAAAGAVGGAVIGSHASKSAADTQAAAANDASQAQLSMFNTVSGNLQPYNAAGQNSLIALNNFLGLPSGMAAPNAQTNLGVTGYQGGPAPGNFTQTAGPTPGPFSFNYNPQNDPEYNFLLSQGSAAISNQKAALGGLNSGATLKALSDYGQQTGLQSYQNEYNNALAGYTANLQNYQAGLQGMGENLAAYNSNVANYQNNFNDWNTTINNIYARLLGLTNVGQTSAANVGNAGIQTGQFVGNNIIGAGNAQAAGTIGSANALSGGISSLFNSPAFQNAINSFGTAGGTGITGSYAPGADSTSVNANNPNVYYNNGIN